MIHRSKFRQKLKRLLAASSLLLGFSVAAQEFPSAVLDRSQEASRQSLLLTYMGKYGNYFVFYTKGRETVLLRYRQNRFDYSRDSVFMQTGAEYRVAFTYTGIRSEYPPEIELPMPPEKVSQPVQRPIRKIPPVYMGEYISHFSAVLETIRY